MSARPLHRLGAGVVRILVVAVALLSPLLAMAIAATVPTPSAAQGSEPQDRDPALASRSVDELLACGAAVTDGGYDPDRGEAPYCGSDPWSIAGELSARNVDASLILTFDSTTAGRKTLIIHSLYLGGRPEASAFMGSVAFGARAARVDGDDVAWAKAYLFKRCDARVLREYVRRPFENRGPSESSFEFSFRVSWFAKCRYEPAIPYLLWLLDAASLNVVAEAEEALRAFYPNDVRFKSLAEVQRYYAGRYRANRNP